MSILVRHGESDANARGLLLGRTDAQLTEAGRQQVEAARSLLVDPVAEVRTSPLSRARDTADILALGPPVTVDDRWVEVDYGEFECQPLHGIPAEVWQRWQSDRELPARGRGDPRRGGRARARRPARSCSLRQVPARDAATATWWW